MQPSDFNFHLPEELIAHFPAVPRRSSRLLVVNNQASDPESNLANSLQHLHFPDVLSFLNPGDLLVFNNTKVIPARLLGRKATGGKLEVLIERLTGKNTALAHIGSNRAPQVGSKIYLTAANSNLGELEATCTGRQGALFNLEFATEQPLLEVLDSYGQLPLPPYIKRQPTAEDATNYQTVYASQPGAVAAPTAGLHFDEALLAEIQAKGVNTAFVTLHVGAGTFQPVKAATLAEHQMHKEWLEVSPETAGLVRETKQAGGKVVAVGTTSVRCLETASASGQTQAFSGETDIFIYPSYQWQCVDKLITNFHLPESTLLMLVSSFAGSERIKHAYAEAVKAGYRFFSYGDAMLLCNSNF